MFINTQIIANKSETKKILWRQNVLKRSDYIWSLVSTWSVVSTVIQRIQIQNERAIQRRILIKSSLWCTIAFRRIRQRTVYLLFISILKNSLFCLGTTFIFLILRSIVPRHNDFNYVVQLSKLKFSKLSLVISSKYRILLYCIDRTKPNLFCTHKNRHKYF